MEDELKRTGPGYIFSGSCGYFAFGDGVENNISLKESFLPGAPVLFKHNGQIIGSLDGDWMHKGKVVVKKNPRVLTAGFCTIFPTGGPIDRKQRRLCDAGGENMIRLRGTIKSGPVGSLGAQQRIDAGDGERDDASPAAPKRR